MDPTIFQRSQVLPRTNLMPFDTLAEARNKDKKQSANFRSLNGSWKFHLSETPQDAPKDFFMSGFDRSQWGDIQVPSNWEMQGYGHPKFRNIGQPYDSKPPFVPENYNPTGSYYRTFKMEGNWREKQHFLYFEGVQSASYVWINGKKVGYNQGAMEPAEYDVSSYLKDGDNSISVRVLHYSDGSYLEDQDTWRLAGIYRDVYLMSTPLTHVHDFFITTDLDNSYRDADLNISAYVKSFASDPSAGFSLRAKVFDEDSKVIASGNLIPTENSDRSNELKKLSTSLPVRNPKKWSAEHPNLYMVTLELLDEKGKLLAVYSNRTGFREVEIRDQAVLVNGVPVKLNGVNSHMMHPKTGHTVDVETMRNDLILMKRFNINTVRTSHYPPNVEYLDLADELGMYIIDETGNEAHSNIQLSGKPEWKAQYLDRVRKMVYRDRNHPSIIIWSAGNESGPGENICASIAEGKRIDPSRPGWLYGGNRDEDPETNPIKCEDIVGPRYVTPFMLEKRFARSSDPRPSFMDEYLSVAGNALGGLDEYWDLIFEHPRLTGGAIWDWVSPGIETEWRTTPDESPKKISVALMNKAHLKEGKFGKALYLSGHDDWLEVYRDKTLDIDNGQLTLSFWVKPEEYNGDAYFITKGNYQYGIWQPNESKLQFYVHTRKKVFVDAELPDDWVGNWHHVAGIYDGKNLTLYLDGKQVSKVANSGEIINGPYPVNIGKSAEIVDNHLGFLTHTTIDRVRIFNSAVDPGLLQSNDVSLKPKAALWLDFESERIESKYYSIGLPGRTYGLVWPDRRIQPELWQLKKSPQPIRVESHNLDVGEVNISNRFHFTNLREMNSTWSLMSNGKVVESGRLNLDMRPFESKTVNIPYRTSITNQAHYVLELSFALREDKEWAKKGHEVAWEQFELSSPNRDVPRPEGPISVESSDGIIEVKGSQFTYKINEVSGLLSSMFYKGREYLREGPKFNIWRAPVANELDPWGTFFTSIGHESDGMGRNFANGWYSLGLNELNHETVSRQILKKQDSVEIKVAILTTATKHSTGFKNEFSYKITGDGRISLLTQSAPAGEFTHWIPKIGLQVKMPKSFQKVDWYGRGPFETYPDRKTGAKFGRFSTTVENEYVPYVIPQDYGNKTDVHWVQISDSDGYGLKVSGDRPFNISTQQHDTDNLTRAAYRGQLKEVDFVSLNLDHRVSGVGGTAISILNKYRVLPKKYAFTFHFEPFHDKK